MKPTCFARRIHLYLLHMPNRNVLGNPRSASRAVICLYCLDFFRMECLEKPPARFARQGRSPAYFLYSHHQSQHDCWFSWKWHIPAEWIGTPFPNSLDFRSRILCTGHVGYYLDPSYLCILSGMDRIPPQITLPIPHNSHCVDWEVSHQNPRVGFRSRIPYIPCNLMSLEVRNVHRNCSSTHMIPSVSIEFLHSGVRNRPWESQPPVNIAFPWYLVIRCPVAVPEFWLILQDTV